MSPCVSIHHVCAWCPRRIEEGDRSPGTEPPCGNWELNLCALEEQPVLFTSERTLQPLTDSVLVNSEPQVNKTPELVKEHGVVPRWKGHQKKVKQYRSQKGSQPDPVTVASIHSGSPWLNKASECEMQAARDAVDPTCKHQQNQLKSQQPTSCRFCWPFIDGKRRLYRPNARRTAPGLKIRLGGRVEATVGGATPGLCKKLGKPVSIPPQFPTPGFL